MLFKCCFVVYILHSSRCTSCHPFLQAGMRSARACTHHGLQAQTASPCACGRLCRSSFGASHRMMAILSPAFAFACRTQTCLRWRWWMLGARAAAAAAAGVRESAASAPMLRMRSSAGGPASVLYRWPGTLVGPSRFSSRLWEPMCSNTHLLNKLERRQPTLLPGGLLETRLLRLHAWTD